MIDKNPTYPTKPVTAAAASELVSRRRGSNLSSF